MKPLSVISRLVMIAAFVVLIGGTALAHDPGLSAAEVRILADRIVAEVSFAPSDLERLEHAGANEVAAKQLLEIKSGNQIVPLQTFTVQTHDANSVHFTLEFPNSSAAELRLSAVVLDQLPRGHKQFLSVQDQDGRLLVERMLSAEAKEITINLQTYSQSSGEGAPLNGERSRLAAERARSSGERFIRFLALGIEHILTGYDHLAFLLALLITGGSLRSNARIITSFTIAHSVTLALATFDVVTLPATIVEPLIAASIVFVGLENLTGRRVAARWLVTFCFGLVHGLGFASILRELGIGAMGTKAAVPLLSFNLGVEIAQVSIATLVLPLVLRLQRHPTFLLKQVPALSLLLTLAGAYWFLLRVL